MKRTLEEGLEKLRGLGNNTGIRYMFDEAAATGEKDVLERVVSQSNILSNNLEVRASCSTLHSRKFCKTRTILRPLGTFRCRWTSVGDCMEVGWVDQRFLMVLFILELQHLKLFGLVCVFLFLQI